MMRQTFRMSLALFIYAGLLLIAGCAVGPNYKAPDMRPADHFDADFRSTLGTTAATQPVGSLSARPVDLGVWWKSLDDPELNALVNQAVRSNFDLRIALARLQQTRENEYAVSGGVVPGLADINPGVDLSAGAGRGSGSDSARGRIAAPVYAGSNTAGLTEITHIVGFDSGWELDLFGHYARAIEAAQADVQAAAETRNDVLVSVVADVVRTYINVRSLQLRLEITRENAASERHMLDLVTVRFQQGLTNELDAAQSSQQLSQTLSNIAPLESEIAAAERRLGVLVGAYPETLRSELAKSTALPAVPPMVGPGMPLQLLRRRPDIRRAERQLAAETARLGVATANLFPSIAVTAGIGFQGQGLGRTPNVSSMIWSVGPALYWPFLDFGQLDALVKVEDFKTKEKLLQYQKQVVTAVEEVDDALSNYAADQDRLAQLAGAVKSAHRAVRLATSRYENGLIEFINVLDAERQLYASEDQYALAHQDVINQFAALYKSLGGGWEGYETPPKAPQPLPAILAAGREVLSLQSKKSKAMSTVQP